MVTFPPIQWLAPLLVWFTSVPSPWALLPACQDALGSQLPLSIAECGLRPGGRPPSALRSVICFRTYSPWGSTLPSIFVLCWIKSVNKWETSPNFSFHLSFSPIEYLPKLWPPTHPSSFTSSTISPLSFSLVPFSFLQISLQNLAKPGTYRGPRHTKINRMNFVFQMCTFLVPWCLFLPTVGGAVEWPSPLPNILSSLPLHLHALELPSQPAVSKVTPWWGITVKQHEDI